MIIKNIETTYAGVAPASKPSSPAHASAWAPETDAIAPKGRRRSGRFAWLLTAITFLLCLSTFSASAFTNKAQLWDEMDRAKSLLDNTQTSENGWEIPINQSWVTKTTYNYLKGVYEAAEALYEDETKDADNYDCDPVLVPLTIARDHFNKVLNTGLMYNYTDWQQMIDDAKDIISPAKFVVSAYDGRDVPDNGKKWAPPVDFDAFNNAIKVVEDLKEEYGVHGSNQQDAKDNQDIIDDAVDLLFTQLSTFTSLLKGGCMPNYDALIASIAEAQYFLDTTAVSVDGSDLSSTIYWIAASDSLALVAAIVDAQSFVAANAGAIATNLATNQAAVDSKKSTLNAIKSSFTVSTGQLSTLLYNYRGLDAAVANAEAALASIRVDENGGNNTEPTDLWVTQSNYTLYTTVIFDYKARLGVNTLLYGDAAETSDIHLQNQQYINVWAVQIKQETDNLRNAAQYGFKPDYSQLSAMITTAQGDALSTSIGVDGHEYLSSVRWVTQDEMDALEAAIGFAQGYVDNNDLAQYSDLSANQIAVDLAENALSTAHFNFLGQLKQGDAYDPTDLTYTDYTDLLAQIGFAKDTLGLNNDDPEDDVVPSTDGTDVLYGTMWLNESYYDLLTTLLDDAEAIKDEVTLFTKTYITATLNALQTAVASAAAKPQMGRGANMAVLVDEIDAAQLLMDSLYNREIAISVSGDGTDVVYGNRWVSQADSTALDNALNAAKNALTDQSITLHIPIVYNLEVNLQIRINAFQSKPTTVAGALPDMTVLENACDSILNLVTPLTASQNNGQDIPTNVQWVSSTDKTALINAIDAAKTASYATHADLLTAIADLEATSDALLASQAAGFKTPYILVTPQKLPNGFVGAVYDTQLVDATLDRVAFSVSSGRLPDGLSLDASSTGVTPTGTGKLVGKPTRAGTYDFTIQATHTSITPVVTETFSHSITIYDAPAFVPTEPDEQESDRVNVQSDIVIRFPASVPMNTSNPPTVLLNGRAYVGYWTSDTTLFIPPPVDYYEYETNYTIVINGLKSKDGFLSFDYVYTFRTSTMPPMPPVPHSVTIKELPEGVISDPLPGEYWVSANEGYQFSLKLTVPPDKKPTLLTNRVINNEIEELTGVPDPEMPETRFLFTVLQIHQSIEITVALSPRNASANEIVGDVRVWASSGKLYVETPQPGSLSVYNITGVLQIQKSVTGSSVIPLSKGIYIVRLNEKAYKIVVP